MHQRVRDGSYIMLLSHSPPTANIASNLSYVTSFGSNGAAASSALRFSKIGLNPAVSSFDKSPLPSASNLLKISCVVERKGQLTF